MKQFSYYIHTFGCQQNVADSERIASLYADKGMKQAKTIDEANVVIINTCMIRHAPENRIRGLVQKLKAVKEKKGKKGTPYKIIVTGCMTGLAMRDKTGRYLNKIRQEMPEVDEFLPIEEVGFDIPPLRFDLIHAWVPISNGCNNYCTFCIVPYTRGREVSRPYQEILEECQNLIKKGYQSITLLGQNVNSYGADLIASSGIQKNPRYLHTAKLIKDKKITPVYVTHLGRKRIPTLFPYLLEEVSQMGFKSVDFMSSNPWDFSDELIRVISENKTIKRQIHIPLQSGDNAVLQRMNRWYTRKQYLLLIEKIKRRIPEVKITTDIIVGFCGETDKEFQNTVDLVTQIKFEKAYISIYSKRPFTVATKTMKDDVPYHIKKKRWEILEKLIYKPQSVNKTQNKELI